MFDLPTFDVDAGWNSEWDQLMQDDWLRRKLDRGRRMQEHAEYVSEHVPELECYNPGYVLDLGPGAGELLEIARHYGHTAIGLDAATGEGGMGDAYIQACQLMHERQNLHVVRCGIDALLSGEAGDEILQHAGEFCLINSRGSIEQLFADCMEGEPHSVHRNCKLLDWVDNQKTRAKMYQFFDQMHLLLRNGGTLLIHANGAANTQVGMNMLCEEAAEVSEQLVVIDNNERILKWRKQTASGSSASTKMSISASGPKEGSTTLPICCSCSDDLSSDESDVVGAKEPDALCSP